MNIRYRQHKLLKLLYNKYQSSDHSINKIADVDFTTIYKQLGCTESQYLLISPKLISEEEVDYSGNGLFITAKGIISYSEKKYLKENRKIKNEYLYDVVKWLIPVMLFIIAVGTTYVNMRLANNTNNNQEQLMTMQQKLDSLLSLKTLIPHQDSLLHK
jgi:hypothetical protein